MLSFFVPNVTFPSFVLFPSTKHHPDKPGGDVDTFRTLKRAQTVLSNSKLRQQYDILGLDLDDDEVEQNSTGVGKEDESQTSSNTIVQDIASAALTTVLQFGVRTGKSIIYV